MLRVALFIALNLMLTGCGATTPGSDDDPTGAYRFSHSRTYG